MAWRFGALLLTTISVYILSVTQPSAGVYELTLHSANGLTINITQTGVYKVLINSIEWLHNSNTFFTADNKTFSTDDGTLKVSLLSQVTPGEDNLGQFTYIRYTWTLDNEKKSKVITEFRAYRETPAIVFSQIFPEELVHTSVNDADSVCSGFPTFQVGGRDIGFMSYGGRFLTTTQFGRWTAGNEDIQSGLYGGPLVLFNEYGGTMVLAPFSQFMAGSIYNDLKTNSVQYGIMGRATRIPRGFTYETILKYEGGIKQTIADYGAVLRKQYGTQRIPPSITTTHLSYWTDNGAYYYHKTDHTKTYQEILLEVKQYADQKDIPYSSFQLDAWWYYIGDGGGVKNWTSRPDVFPKGLNYFSSQLHGIVLAAHNKYWASNTDYAKVNGGKWNFIVEKENSLALPLDEDFWNYLFMSSKEDWPLMMYEQDFLDKQFSEMDICVENITVGRQWLMLMGAAAMKNNLPIQYCMPMARHLLQSVEINSVTQARASDDYTPGNSQWDIGLSSILLYALDIIPFKDNFWTTTLQPNNPYDRIEPYPELEAMVATFSTGPVGVSDAINKSNLTLIRRSISKQGVILKPSRPAMPLNGYLQHRAFGSGGISGLIWSTSSDIIVSKGIQQFGHILVFEVDEPINLTPDKTDLELISDSWAFNDNDPINSLQKFDGHNPIRLPLLLRKDFQLWHTTPLINFGTNQVLILGEVSKWVSVSPQRILNVEPTTQNITLTLSMATGVEETVDIDLMLNMKHMTASCTTTGKRSFKMKMTISGLDKVHCENE